MHIYKVCLIGLLAPLFARADGVRRLVDEALPSLLGERPHQVRIEKQGPGSVIEVRSGSVGTYRIYVGPDVATLPVASPDVALPARARLTGELRLPETWDSQYDLALGRLRSLLRADPYLHPMNTPESVVPQATPPQREALAQLIGLQRALLMFPPGLGKTVVAGLLAREMAKDGKRVLIVYQVQSKDVLDQATTSLKAVVGIPEARVRRVYGTSASRPLHADDVDLIATSRSVAAREIKDFTARIKDFDGHVLYVMDEAQYLGKKDGEFATILKEINRTLRPNDVLLGLSATPWHTELGPVLPLFGNNLVTAFVSATELAYYRATGRYIELARLILFRAMEAGYLSPITAYDEVAYLEDGRPVRDFLRDSTIETSKLSPPAERPVFKRDWQIHLPLVERMVKEIHANVRREGKRVTYWNRGIIFVPTIDHANAYADLINKIEGRGSVRARAYHYQTKDRPGTLTWFDEPGRQHKYLIAVETIGKAFNRRSINHLILAKHYSLEDPVGMRELIQNVGRLVRIGAFKTQIAITDFSGDVRRLLFDDLDQSLVDSFFTAQGRRDLAEVRRRLRVVDTSTNLVRLNGGGFTSTKVPVPSSPAAPKIEEKWTLARLLLDGNFVASVIPGMPRKPTGGYRPLGYYVCRMLMHQEPATDEPGAPAGFRLARTLGFDPSLIRGTDLDDALSPHCHRRIFATARIDEHLTRHEAKLLQSHAAFATRVEFKDSDLRDGISLLDNRTFNGTPWSPRKSTSFKWTLAEVLLHPLLPKLLNVEATNLAQLILDGGYEGQPWAADWGQITWRDRLFSARTYGVLNPAEFAYLNEMTPRQFALETLKSIDQPLFNQETTFTDDDFYRLARRLPAGDPTRRKAETSLALAGYHPGAIKDADELTVPLSAFRASEIKNPAAWAEPWTVAKALVFPEASRAAAEYRSDFRQIPVHLIEHLGLSQLRVAVRSAAQASRVDRAAEQVLANAGTPAQIREVSRQTSEFSDEAAMMALAYAGQRANREDYAALTTYVRSLGAVPARQARTQRPRVPGIWTVARLMLDPAALRVFFPLGVFREDAHATWSFGDFLCADLTRATTTAFESEREVVRTLMEGLGIGAADFRRRGLDSELTRACEDGALGTVTGLRADAEARLIALLPQVFGVDTMMTDRDLDPVYGPPLLERTPLIPAFANRSTSLGSLRRNWTAGEYLLSPFVPYLLNVKAPNLAATALGLGGASPWTTIATKAAGYGVIDGMPQPYAPFDRERWVKQSLAFELMDPARLGAKVPFNDQALYRRGAKILQPAPRRVIESYLISRGYTRAALWETPRKSHQTLALDDLPGSRRSSEIVATTSWTQPWSLARVLVDPLAALAAGERPEVAALARNRNGLATFAGRHAVRGPQPERPAVLGVVRELRRQRALGEALVRHTKDEVSAVWTLSDVLERERALIAEDPVTFGREVAGFTDEGLLRALQAGVGAMGSDLAYALLSRLRSLAPLPPAPASNCEGDLAEGGR